jgi:DNA-binding IclR family transcriptional regulator
LKATACTAYSLLRGQPEKCSCHNLEIKIDLPEVTEKSVIDKNVLLSQLNTIRNQGYAASCGEKIPGAMCISATISGYEFPAAISVLGPESRLKYRETELIQEIKNSANRIIEKIGRSFLKRG